MQLDEEMHNTTSGQDHHYDTPRAMSKSTSSSNVQQQPVRHKLPRAATMDVCENEPPYVNRKPVVSQYSHLQSESTDPSALVVSPTHTEDYIATGHSRHHYQNVDADRYEYAQDWLGGNDKTVTDELVIQPSRGAEAYTKTNHPQPAVHDYLGGRAATLPALPYHTNTTSPSDIRYPPPLVSEAPRTLPDSRYETLRMENPHTMQPILAPVSRQLQDRRHSDCPVTMRKTDQKRGNDTPPSTRRTAGQYDHLVVSIKESLPQASDAICVQYLTKNDGNMDSALRDIKVHILMDMGLENTSTEDCRKALGHCQWKLDRAAEWLIEQSIS